MSLSPRRLSLRPTLEDVKRYTHWLTQASVLLVMGTVAALVGANVDPERYALVVLQPLTETTLFGHEITLRFIVNDVLMVLFFGMAAKELLSAVRPGGALYPPSRAANPIIASLGGVAVPALLYLLLVNVLFADAPDHDLIAHGWAIPTATDITLAWVGARALFGSTHPAVDFLLMLAIVDDIIGIGIIAAFYSDGGHSMSILGLVSCALGVVVAWQLRRAKIRAWTPYVFGAGGLMWLGLLQTSIHPALALVPIIPFMARADARAIRDPADHFERAGKPVVNLWLFAFGFANAGVALNSVTLLSWVVLLSLVVGKLLGVIVASLAAARLGLQLPKEMTAAHVVQSGLLAGIGLTVALFITTQAFPSDSSHQSAAKMGALFSAGVGLAVLAWARVVRAQRPTTRHVPVRAESHPASRP